MERGGRMKFFRDKQIKGYLLFIFIHVIFLLGFVLWFCQNQVLLIKSMYLEHDIVIASSLLEQEVSEEVIATAISSTIKNVKGMELLNSIGIKKETSSSLFPFLSEFRVRSCYLILSGIIVFIVVLFIGTSFFLWKRSKLYSEAYNIVNCLADNDYSHHLPQHSEGEIYQLFASIENLATMLQSKNETEQKTKEFLKNTISDISHQLKTPLAALAMYQEIIENEPDNREIVEEFSRKIGIAIKRMEQLIQAMLKITRLDTGNVIFEKKSFLVKDVIENAKPNPKDVDEILDLLGLTERRHHLPGQLSGGQQQRVAIGRALITKPKLILADEPTGNLDSKNSRDVMDMLTNASRHFRQTILMITHNDNLTASVDRVFRVSDGILMDLGGMTNEKLS